MTTPTDQLVEAMARAIDPEAFELNERFPLNLASRQVVAAAKARAALTALRAKEVELGPTPEMIEAGASVLAGYDNGYFAGDDLWAKRIYAAMQAAAPKPPGAE